MDVILGILLVLALLALALVGLWLLAIRGNASKPDFYGLGGWLYAHRGLHKRDRGIPENSLRAFRLAADNGYGAELDVHLSRDKRLVVMHDENLKRTTGLDKNICDATTDTLDALRLEGMGEKVPYLEEVLPIFADKAPLIIELKPHGDNYARLAYRVCKLLDQVDGLQYCIESFDPRVLLWLKKNRPEILRGQLAQDFVKDRAGLKRPLAFLLTHLLENCLTKPDFIAYRNSDRRVLSPRLCKKLWHVQQVRWTVKSQQEADRAKAEGSIVIFEGFAAQ